MGLDDPDELIDRDSDEDVDDEDEDLFDDEDDSDEDEDNADDEDDVDADDDGDSDQNRSGKGISPKKFSRVRSQAAAERRRRKEVEGENTRINAKLKELEDAESAKPAVSDDDIKAEAAAMVVFPANATEDQKKQIIQTAEAQLRRIINLVAKGNKPPKELGALETQISELKDKAIFNDEWDDFSDSIPKLYPQLNATPRQIRLARRAMDKLARAPKFADKDFEYIWFKNRDIFDQILRRSRSHTFESRGPVRGRDDENGGNSRRTPARNLTPKELEKRNKEIEGEAAAIDRKSGWQINNPDGSSVED